MVYRGLTVADMDKMTLGMCVNFVRSYDRLTARANGLEVADPEVQYRQLKSLVPEVEARYKAGRISKDRYEAFMQSIADYEAGD